MNFKDLVNDLYKLYKVRLWMSAVNPASFSTNAINQPPTGIGPGAIVTHSQSGPDFDNSYTMVCGTDGGTCGAILALQLVEVQRALPGGHLLRDPQGALSQQQVWRCCDAAGVLSVFGRLN